MVSNWILLNYRMFSLTSGQESIATASYLQIASQSFSSSQTFPTPDALYNAWSRPLEVWEFRDSKIFIETMVAHYAELVLFWKKVMDDTTGGFQGGKPWESADAPCPHPPVGWGKKQGPDPDRPQRLQKERTAQERERDTKPR
jgi:hypothetical protein